MSATRRDAGPSRPRVAAGFLLGAVGISFAAIFVRLALPAPPVVTGFYRMLLASLALGLWLRLRPGSAPLSRRALGFAAAAGLCFGCDLALWHTAIVRTSVANATLLVNTTPLHVALFSALVWGERPGARLLVGGLLALAGVFLLLGVAALPEARTGDLLALVAALFYSGYLLLMKATRRRADAIPALAVASATATLALGVVAGVRGDAFSGFPLHSWASFAGAALVSQLGGVLGIVWALRYARATFASVALLAQPVGTAALGWLLLGERLTAIQALGGSAVLVGIVLAARSGADPEAWPSVRQAPRHLPS